MTDRALAEAALEALDAAMGGLLAARRMLQAAMESSGCPHANRVSVSTFDSPTAWLCPDCGVRGD